MSQFNAKIITPHGEVFNEKVEAISAPGAEGSFGVLNLHTPMIVKLQKGIFSATSEGNKKYFILSGGVLEVNDAHNVMVLADDSQTAADLAEAESMLKGENKEA